MLIQNRMSTEGAAGDAAIVPAVSSFTNTDSPGAGTVYSGVRFAADGDIYRRQIAGGGYGKVGTWLLNGTNTDFSVNATVTSGTLDNGTTGSDLQLNANRDFDEQNSSPGTSETASVSFTISNWNGGSPNVEYSTRVYVFTAIMESP